MFFAAKIQVNSGLTINTSEPGSLIITVLTLAEQSDIACFYIQNSTQEKSFVVQLTRTTLPSFSTQIRLTFHYDSQFRFFSEKGSIQVIGHYTTDDKNARQKKLQDILNLTYKKTSKIQKVEKISQVKQRPKRAIRKVQQKPKTNIKSKQLAKGGSSSFLKMMQNLDDLSDDDDDQSSYEQQSEQSDDSSSEEQKDDTPPSKKQIVSLKKQRKRGEVEQRQSKREQKKDSSQQQKQEQYQQGEHFRQFGKFIRSKNSLWDKSESIKLFSIKFFTKTIQLLQNSIQQQNNRKQQKQWKSKLGKALSILQQVLYENKPHLIKQSMASLSEQYRYIIPKSLPEFAYKK